MDKENIMKIGLESYKKGAFDTIQLMIDFLIEIKQKQQKMHETHLENIGKEIK